MIVDSHIHVWQFSSARYPWQPLANVTPDDEWPVESEIEAMAKGGLDKGILIQPSMYSFDNRYLVDCGRRFPDKFRLVGLVDPRTDRLEADIEILAAEGVRGLRLAAMLRPDIPWYNDRRADRLWQKAGELKMILGLLVTPAQVGLATETIRRFPETRVVIDHLARPDKIDDPDRLLFQDLLALACFEQVYIKVSALGFMSQEPYPHGDMLALVRQVFDKFGPGRMLWGTDTPMSQDPARLSAALDLIGIALPGGSPPERAQITGGTAAQLFGWTG
jgi:predicted TIM-barrel fold metal-dependent hydrolase